MPGVTSSSVPDVPSAGVPSAPETRCRSRSSMPCTGRRSAPVWANVRHAARQGCRIPVSHTVSSTSQTTPAVAWASNTRTGASTGSRPGTRSRTGAPPVPPGTSRLASSRPFGVAADAAHGRADQHLDLGPGLLQGEQPPPAAVPQVVAGRAGGREQRAAEHPHPVADRVAGEGDDGGAASPARGPVGRAGRATPRSPRRTAPWASRSSIRGRSRGVVGGTGRGSQNGAARAQGERLRGCPGPSTT